MEGIYPEEEMGSIYHSSHLHILQLIPADHGFPQTRCCDPTATTMMNTKKRRNPVYGCRPCNFYIHKNCAELLPYIRHPSHPAHTLTLVHASPYLQGTSECDGCCKPIDSSTGFSYHCAQCSFDLHTHCAFLPPTISNPSSGHPHLLSLHYPDVFSVATYQCDLCRKMIPGKAWLYHCLPCDFEAHTACILARLGGSPLGSAAPRPMEGQGQPTAAGQPPNPLMTGSTPAVRPGQVSVATNHTETSRQADVPGKTLANGQQGEIPDYIKLQLEMMKLQMSMNVSQAQIDLVSDWRGPRYYWF